MKGHRIIKLLTVAVFGLVANFGISQSSSLSGVGVLGGCSMSFFDNHHFDYGGMFASPGVITGSRTGSLGLIYFNTGSSWTNADELQYIDGYVVNATSQGFTFPIGHNAMYKPAAVTAAASATTAAYWNGNVMTVAGPNANTAISAISSVDYWQASGSTASQLTLSWDVNSNIAGLTGSNLAGLSIVAWNGTGWDVIPSTVDVDRLDTASSGRNFLVGTPSDLTTGSITTSGSINLDGYQYFSLASLAAPLVQLSAANNGIGVDEVDMLLYPNPAVSFEELTIAYHVKDYSAAELVIFDMQGQVLYKQSLDSSTGVESIDYLPEVKNGTYMVTIITETGKQKATKVVLLD